MKSKRTFPTRFTKIDGLVLSDHHHLRSTDVCLYLGEYAAGAGFQHSFTNRLIINFKKPMSHAGKLEWKYKGKAIRCIAKAFERALGDDSLDDHTFVPIPPSKARNDPGYDDRMTQMLKAIPRNLDVQELIIQTKSTAAAHSRNEPRLGPDKLEGLYQINTTLEFPKPRCIAVVDDVLTTGAHFRAVSSVLSGAFPGAKIIGLFIARTSATAHFDVLDDIPEQ